MQAVTLGLRVGWLTSTRPRIQQLPLMFQLYLLAIGALFVATYIQDSIAVVGGGDVPADIASSGTGNFFVPAAEELFFAFEHAFTSKGFDSTRNIQATVMHWQGEAFRE